MTAPDMITRDDAWSALCIWEAICEATPDYLPGAFGYRQRHGACATRDAALALAPACNAAWQALPDDSEARNECFDWGFVPNWLDQCVDWLVQGMPIARPAE